ncbi:hypothetical protein EB796_025107 [Bugula neritina]|uniref:Flavoprotein domain-containing protein n=1 Tax=Bugula neritina TaxID=10212 RepID=A0A7J7IRK8_BUGNE|nr:hypothetical protein EB796_025107 [Bugula neritina]
MAPKILIGCCGSVATVKLKPLLAALQSGVPDVVIKVILTEHAQHFAQVEDSTNVLQYYTDADEYKTWKKMGDDVLHIELRKWADIFIIAPLSANSLAKISNGLCDNLLTCVVRAWDPKKPLLFAPAMNTLMLQHPITQPQINVLVSWGHIEIPTCSKKLACGDVGYGAMAEVDTIAEKVIQHLSNLSK